VTLVLARFVELGRGSDCRARAAAKRTDRVALVVPGRVGSRASFPWAESVWHLSWWDGEESARRFRDRLAEHGVPSEGATLWWSEPGLLPDLKTARHMAAELRSRGPSTLVFGEDKLP
jgi:hypothetical protein